MSNQIICRGVADNCCNPDSYGMICVGCNQCGRFTPCPRCHGKGYVVVERNGEEGEIRCEACSEVIKEGTK